MEYRVCILYQTVSGRGVRTRSTVSLSLLECVVGFLLCIRCVSQAPTPGRGSGQSLLLNLVLLLHCSPLGSPWHWKYNYTSQSDTTPDTLRHRHRSNNAGHIEMGQWSEVKCPYIKLIARLNYQKMHLPESQNNRGLNSSIAMYMNFLSSGSLRF